MENALESVLSSLESRSAKLRKWAEMNIHVQSQEVAGLEAAVGALQQQQQQLQRHRLTALPAIEEATLQEISQLRQEREALTQHMRRDAERLLDGLGQFQKAKESSWEASMPAERAKEKCAELWDLLAHVKDTRRSASEALAAKLSDALGEAEKAIGEEAESRREAEAAINRCNSSAGAARNAHSCRTPRNSIRQLTAHLRKNAKSCAAE
ncbi:uncharacterized protein LOC34622672 [Cyclospora cayetanensis]|uniref:Uncharacterized protein LOC34622672 n=1 Tax=Cyclospora cayetanensis TaxID=88456 RepID=A0A6P6RZI4_9EIME|nr:uncharacterized protein LOC34622672 [Cyclospora cayetanensis]